MISHHLAELRSGALAFGIALVGAKPAKPNLVRLLQAFFETAVPAPRCFQSLQARLLPAGICHRNDVILAQAAPANNALIAGEVWLHASADGLVVTLCNLFRPIGKFAGGVEQRWDASENHLELIDTSSIVATVVHSPVNRGIVRLIAPWHLRNRDLWDPLR